MKLATKLLLLAGALTCGVLSAAARSTLTVYDTKEKAAVEIPVRTDLQELSWQLPSEEAFSENTEILLSGNAPYPVETTIIPEKSPYPFSAAVRIMDKNGWLTGVMVGPYAVLTVSHGMFNLLHFADFDKPERKKLHHPSDMSVVVSGETAKVERILVPNDTLTATDSDVFENNDYALMIINKPLGEKFGYWGVKKSRIKKGAPLAVLGYPSLSSEYWTGPAAPTKTAKPLLWYSIGKRGKEYPHCPAEKCFSLDLPVAPGNSGSPVFVPARPGLLVGVCPGVVKMVDAEVISFINHYRNEKPDLQPDSQDELVKSVQKEIRTAQEMTFTKKHLNR